MQSSIDALASQLLWQDLVWVKREVAKRAPIHVAQCRVRQRIASPFAGRVLRARVVCMHWNAREPQAQEERCERFFDKHSYIKITTNR